MIRVERGIATYDEYPEGTDFTVTPTGELKVWNGDKTVAFFAYRQWNKAEVVDNKELTPGLYKEAPKSGCACGCDPQAAVKARSRVD